MNETIKAMSLNMLDDVMDLVVNIDKYDEPDNIEENLEEVANLLKTIKKGIFKIK